MGAEGPSGGGSAGGASGRLPEAVVRDRAMPSSVWLIPIVAALVGLFLAYRAYSERGPTISITFASAAGLEAGKTRVKYKEVDIGLIEAVDLSEDLSRVIVTASLVSGAERYLTENTRFWAVRAEVSAGQISGLGTFLSGVYVAIDPSTEGKHTTRFVGLEKAPVVTSDESGSIFNLRAETLGSIDIGSPVYYRWLQVGQVAGYELDDDGNQVQVQVFVESPHDHRVRTTTRFWNAAGFDATITAEGITIDSPSLVSMLVGGIAFETPSTFEVARDVPSEMIFELYPNKQATRQTRYSLKSTYLLNFQESVAGLDTGSPVEFQGIKIGEVKDVRIELEPVNSEIRIPVVIEIEPERLGLIGPIRVGLGDDPINELVGRGLRARLKTASLITGRKAVDFALIEDAAPARIRLGDQYPELPTISGGFDAIAAQVGRVMTRVDQIPIESIGRNMDELLVTLRSTLKEMEGLAGAANRDLIPSLASSLKKLENTLESADSMIAPDSEMANELSRLVVDLAEAARSIRGLAERLEEHPEELLRGKAE